MALSFKSVQKAYQVFHQIKDEFVPGLSIPSWPEDMSEWEESERKEPRELIVYGSGKKSDDGWESITFFMENRPSKEMQARFKELAQTVPNTSLCEQYHRNENLWVIGWF